MVDLDGTLTPTDTLVESIIQVVKQSPINFLRMPFWLLGGRAELKKQVAARSSIAPALLPYRQDFLSFLQAEKSQGRRIVLATAAHHSIATGVATHLGLFDTVLATDGYDNLKGIAKLEAIKNEVGDDFVYAGDSAADLPIWQAAKAAILVGAVPGLAVSIRKQVPIEKEFPGESGGFALWIRALRVHQWLKNLLLFVPLLTAFSFTHIAALVTMVVAFLAFSLAASATYLVNDLWDLESDRAHPRKRLRPFASARIPIQHGIAMSVFLMLAALAMALAISTGFFCILVLYVALTSAYSWMLKGYVLVDVIMLSVLYTLRILAGSVAIGVTTSSWLLAFSIFMFLSLALVKRCSELVSLELAEGEITRGRDYRGTDLVVLWPLGLGAALSSVVVFGLFINSPDTQARYATPALLWLVALGLIYWLARLWIKTSRGEMHDDPVVYAIKDFGSRTTVFTLVMIVLIGRFATLEFPL
ncbi:UbiA family prenyltransferase [Rhodoferax sp. WC2427]|uniref:UbiA family prenyltransferase n=1 Tax=Rhodoferax sp. WC2427 TaxID=3234144 RepID=UPI003466A8CE